MRAFLFDFDGTLADSFAAIAASVNHVRSKFHLTSLPVEEVRSHVGFGVKRLLADLVPGAPLEQALAFYDEHHPTVILNQTHLLPEVASTLATLRLMKLKLGICSNKTSHYTRPLATSLGIGEYLDLVLGPNDVSRPKPAPDMLLAAMGQLGVTPAETWYVGDMYVDATTGEAAGVTVLFVPGREVDRGPPGPARPVRVLERFSELIEIARSGDQN